MSKVGSCSFSFEEIVSIVNNGDKFDDDRNNE